MRRYEYDMILTSKKAFLLIEMIVAVSILSIGMVLVLRSFLTAASAAGYMSNRVEAARILEDKAAKLEELAFNGGLGNKQVSEDIFINFRRATYSQRVDTSPIEASQDILADIILNLAWQEGPRSCEEVLATRMINTKREEDAALSK